MNNSVQIKTPTVSQNIQTSLAEDYLSGTSLSVLSSIGFVINNYIVIGEPGLENTEVTHLTVAPPDSGTMTISALQFPHPKGTPVYYISWDKYSLEYETTDTGPWVVYGSMPASLAFDALSIEYRDSSATSTYKWRYRYYSTEKSAYSDYSDVISTTGWPRNSVGYMIREVRKAVNDLDAKTISDTEIIRFFNACHDKVYTLYDRWWFLLKTGTAIPTVTNTIKYALPTDFGRMDRLQYEYVFGSEDTVYNLKYINRTEFDYVSRDQTASGDDNLKLYSIYPGDSSNPTGYIKVFPRPNAGAMNITPIYYKTFTDLVSYANQTEVPVPDLLENYAIARILGIRKEDDKESEYDTMWKSQIQLLKGLQRKQSGPPRQLWTFHGHDADRRLYGNRESYNDKNREDFW